MKMDLKHLNSFQWICKELKMSCRAPKNFLGGRQDRLCTCIQNLPLNLILPTFCTGCWIITSLQPMKILWRWRLWRGWHYVITLFVHWIDFPSSVQKHLLTKMADIESRLSVDTNEKKIQPTFFIAAFKSPETWLLQRLRLLALIHRTLQKLRTKDTIMW